MKQNEHSGMFIAMYFVTNLVVLGSSILGKLINLDRDVPTI